MRNRIMLPLAAFFMIHCAPKPTENIDLSKARASFMLTDGSSISTDEYDEYNPVLITRNDGRLALIFGSNRDCGVCTAGYHNMFIAVSTEPYYDDLVLPVFNDPVVILPNGSTPAESITPMRFAAQNLGPFIGVAFESGGGIYSFQFDDNDQLTGIGSGYGGIGNITRVTDSLLGFGPFPASMLTRDGAGVTRYSTITASHNGRAVANDSYANADTIVAIDPYNTFFLGATFAVDSGYLMMGTLYENFGYHPNFQDAVDDAEIYLTSANIHSPGPFSNDVLIFSAHDGVSDDLYAVTSHSVAELWDMVGIYGDFSDRGELRNMWSAIPTTLPANRGFMAAAVYGSKGYFIGGTADGTNAVNTIYEFDFDSETFTNCGGSCGTWPVNIWHAPATESGGLIYVVGGATGSGAAFGVNTIRTFNPGNLAINSSLNNLPVSRQSVSTVLANGKVYALGGVSTATDCGGTNYGCTSNYSYTISGNSWSGALAVVSHNFSAGGAATYGDSIFAFGGYVNGSIAETTSVGEYSITGNSWIDCGSTCPTLASGRYSLAVVTYGQYAYVIGGANQGGTSFNTIEEFDMSTLAFTQCDGGCATMPLARNGGSALLYNDQIYYFGGNNAGPYVNTIFKYVP